MADDLLRQFCARAARTLSIAFEVFQELKRRDKETAETALTRLELELAGWQAEIEAHDAYQAALSEFNAAQAVWQHLESIGTKPEAPTWPPILPQTAHDIDIACMTLYSLKSAAANFRGVIKYSISFDTSLSIMAGILERLGQSLDSMKGRLGIKADAKDAEPMPPQAQPTSDDRVTLDEPDNRDKIRQKLPDNIDVRDLCKLLEKNRTQIKAGTKTEIGVAREHTRELVGKCPKADNLLRQARRYTGLWK